MDVQLFGGCARYAVGVDAVGRSVDRMKRKPDNPRQISKTEYARLQADLERFGDLGGIVQ